MIYITGSLLSYILLCVLTWSSGPQKLGLGASATSLSCNTTSNCTENAICVLSDGFCECSDGYQFVLEHGSKEHECNKCPGLHDPCDTDCCYPPTLTKCVNGVCQCDVTFFECSEMDRYTLATQIALGSAIILSIACCLIILWKSCKRRRELTRRRVGTDIARANSSGSLSSGQLVIIERLRHRPPGYHDRGHIRIEKPPTYEETLEQPLRFPIINVDQHSGSTPNLQQIQDNSRDSAEIRSETHLEQPNSLEASRRGQAEEVGGIDNLAFVIADEKEGFGDDSDLANAIPLRDLHM